MGGADWETTILNSRGCGVACAALVGALAGVACAQPRVGMVAAASNTANPLTNTRFTDPRDKLSTFSAGC